jgi:hypothetical protein
VSALALESGRLWAGGAWNGMSPTGSSAGYAMFDPSTGALARSFAPTDPWITSIVSRDGVVYVGTNHPFAADAASGDSLPWDPHIDGVTTAMAATRRWIYVAGGFTTAGGVARSGLASVDPLTGAVSDWNPGAVGLVHAVAAVGGVVYVGGDLLPGGPRSLAAIDDPEQLLGAPIDVTPPAVALSVRPNPVAGASILVFTLARPARVAIDLVDVAGRRVHIVARETPMGAGTHAAPFGTNELGARVYWLRLAIDSRATTGKVVVIR